MNATFSRSLLTSRADHIGIYVLRGRSVRVQSTCPFADYPCARAGNRSAEGVQVEARSRGIKGKEREKIVRHRQFVYESMESRAIGTRANYRLATRQIVFLRRVIGD